MSRPTATHRPRQPRPRHRSPQPSTLFEAPSPPGDESLLLDDLVTLVALGLLEERGSPEGTVYALTELGHHTPEFDV
jgi:hypothetical protein